MFTKWCVYRVIGITDHMAQSKFYPSLSAKSYCTQGTVFWLSKHNIEDSKSKCILLETTNGPNQKTLLNPCMIRNDNDFDSWIVEFEWDHGKYIGTIEITKNRLSWDNNQISDAMLYNISSM